MLEVCFNDSVKGALAQAQDCKNSAIGGAVAIITDKKWIFSYFYKKKELRKYRKQQLELQKKAVSLGGKREDIAGISFGLWEGDIKSSICLEACPRKACISERFSFDRYNEQEDMEKSINKFWTQCIEDLQKLKSNPPKIRVWLDDTPEAQCGLLFLADLLRDSQTEVHIVPLPKRIVREDNCVVEYRSWGEVEPQLYGTYLDRERVLTKEEIADLANQWERLKAENSPLRVVENGSVISADVSYYDDLIRKEFPKDSCKIAYIIGSALGKQKIPTGDVFIAKRIQHFITKGELAVLGKAEKRFYSTVVKTTK